MNAPVLSASSARRRIAGRAGHECAHAPPVERPDRADPAEARLAEHPGHAGAGVDRPDRDLVGLASWNGRADRNGARLSRLHDDEHAVGGRGWRGNFLSRRPRARRRAARRRRRACRACAADQSRAWARDLGFVPRVWAAPLCRDGRKRRLARSGDAIFERRLHRQRPRLAHERARQRHPRHGQYALSIDGRVHRRRLADPAVAAVHLWLRPDARARRRRRRGRGHSDDSADGRHPRMVHPERRLACALPLRAPQMGVLRRHSARRRGGRAQHAADDFDRRDDNWPRRRRCRTASRRRLWHGLAIGISAHSLGVRPWRAAGCACRYEYRRRPEQTGFAYRHGRRRDRLRDDGNRSASSRRSGPRRGSTCSAPIR